MYQVATKSIKMTLNLICHQQKLTPGGADLGKFKKIVQNPRYLHYLTAFMGDTGIKISGTL